MLCDLCDLTSFRTLRQFLSTWANVNVKFLEKQRPTQKCIEIENRVKE